MAPQVSENLSRIQKSASELNKLADEATEHIKAIDGFLRAVGPGIPFWPDFHKSFSYGREKNPHGHNVHTEYFLGYDRDGNNTYGLVVMADGQMTEANGSLVYCEDEPTLPATETVWVRGLPDCSRDIRIAAIKALPEFLEGMADALDSRRDDAKNNIQKAKAAIEDLQAAAGTIKAQAPNRRQAHSNLIVEGTSAQARPSPTIELNKDGHMRAPRPRASFE